MASPTLFDRLLASPIGSMMFDRDEMLNLRRQIDWEAECDRLTDPMLEIPDYYSSQNFHGVPGGYQTVNAAISYDSVTQYLLPPSERWVRQGLLNRIRSHPRRILDVGCGTGTSTAMLAEAYPDAEVIGVDLSAHMLVMAERKSVALKRGRMTVRHAAAEATPFPDASFDLVTMSLLLHETPVSVSQAILRECFRLLVTGGEVLILDGAQQTLLQAPWLTEIFEEPYIQDYASGSVEDWMVAAGFGGCSTELLWGLNQVTRGVKGIVDRERLDEDMGDWPSQIAIA